jgi:hypothetical protein
MGGFHMAATIAARPCIAPREPANRLERMGKIGVFVLGIVVGIVLVPVLIIQACT